MMNILRALSFAATLSAVCLVCGACSAPPMPADGQTVYEGEPREIFADDLRGEIEVGVPTMRRTPGNQLQVVVPLTNVARRDLRLLVQVQFLDDALLHDRDAGLVHAVVDQDFFRHVPRQAWGAAASIKRDERVKRLNRTERECRVAGESSRITAIP